MKSFKVIAALILVIAFVLGGLSLAMAAVTAPLTFPEAQAELSVRSGQVELQKSGSTTWATVSEPTEVTLGDTVRTDADGEADINLYDQGVLHLASDSTMMIDESLWDPESPQIFQGEIFLEAGNLWSRMFDFVSPDSSFQVRTTSTVATVRGTTFWVGALAGNTSRVYVDNHTVEVRSLEDQSTLDVTAGEMARLRRSDGQSYLRFAEPPSGKDLETIEKYRRWDKEYEDEVKARQLAFAKQARKIDPESSLYSFQRFSEHLRLLLTLNDEKQDALRERFMAGRVLDAYVELSEHKDLTRTRILLQHAQAFGGEEIAERPLVRRAVLYFGRSRAENPVDLEGTLEEAQPEQGDDAGTQPNVQTQIDTQVQLFINGVPVDSGSTTPSDPEPVVQGETTEAAPTTDTTTSTQPVFNPKTYQPIEYQPVQYAPSTQ